ncbi:MAG: sugar nucleotide-binding protein [Cyclobacteriaceae bacterium]|nr:sugar nucleotide-binding protein [Cyclobacteriaceae bacterium]
MECTINRIGNTYRDQLSETGHYTRWDTAGLFKSLNLQALRYPILWERYEPSCGYNINWSPAQKELKQLRDLDIKPIVGLLHHGSGPRHTNLLDDHFAEKFSVYAGRVAAQFPDIEDYCPVNEPLTTARFSGLYGLWYPHQQSSLSFARMLINQLKGVVLAMRAIRKINPKARLIQTEDLSKVHSTHTLTYQAEFENERRWLTYDLLGGHITSGSRMWKYFTSLGIDERELEFFLEHSCMPDILGLNYYVTSERYLDERCDLYPGVKPGGNGIHAYVDVDAYRHHQAIGLASLVEEVAERYTQPLAITESHLACTREEQMRWLKEIWTTCCQAKARGIKIEAVTAWALFGAYDWDSLVTKAQGHYEVGVFDIRKHIRPTAISKMISSLGAYGDFYHPLLDEKGWWQSGNRNVPDASAKNRRPLLIIGKHGTLATAYAKACVQRSIFQISLSRHDIDITNLEDVINTMEAHNPWGVINASGYVNVDEAESQQSECFMLNVAGPEILARACRDRGIPFMTFSSDQVFSGNKKTPYKEGDVVAPVNHYGVTKAQSEKMVASAYPEALIIRTSAFFGPWDNFNFAHTVLNALENKTDFCVVRDVVISPTYVPHLVQFSLDLFIDQEEGIWHLSNDGGILSWADFARELAARGGYKYDQLKSTGVNEMNWKAKRPVYSVLQSGRGATMPTLERAIDDFFNQRALQPQAHGRK